MADATQDRQTSQTEEAARRPQAQPVGSTPHISYERLSGFMQ